MNAHRVLRTFEDKPGSRYQLKMVDAVSSELESMFLQTHALCMFREQANASARWGDTTMPRRAFRVGALSFAPAGETLEVHSDRTQKSVFRFNDNLLRDAAEGVTNLDDITLRFGEISDAAAYHLAAAFRIAMMSRECQDSSLIRESTALALGATILSSMSERAEKAFSSVRSGLSEGRLRLVSEYIEANIDQQIGIADLASVANLSPFHFSRSFKESMQMSPMRYVTERRVARAKAMLAGTEPIAVVALACGFCSQSHFTDTFRKLTGSTPAAFRAAL